MGIKCYFTHQKFSSKPDKFTALQASTASQVASEVTFASPPYEIHCHNPQVLFFRAPFSWFLHARQPEVEGMCVSSTKLGEYLMQGFPDFALCLDSPDITGEPLTMR
jgi:hypothetical protein